MRPSVLVAVAALVALSLLGGVEAGASDPGLAPGLEPEFHPLHVPEKPFVLPEGRDGTHAATVFGNDDRVPVEDTSQAPWRSVALIFALDLNGNILWECTGSLLNYNVVLTAAHCVWDDFLGTYIDALAVAPGATAEEPPYGIGYAFGFSVPNGFTNDAGPEFDFALAFLAGNPFQGLIGPYMTVGAPTDGYLDHPDTMIASAGFPADKPFGTMWFSSDFVLAYDEALLYTQMDAYPGQSGSPIYTINASFPGAAVIGVYSTEGLISNQAVRFNENHLAAFHQYCADRGCSVETAVIDVGTGPPPGPPPEQPPPETDESQPGTFFGKANGAQVGQAVAALIRVGNETQVCGTALVEANGGPVYLIVVLSEAQRAGCGAPGRPVMFYFAPFGNAPGNVAPQTAPWRPGSGPAFDLSAGPPLGEHTAAGGLTVAP
jgi:V8-like Glu-specific endopeptidase